MGSFSLLVVLCTFVLVLDAAPDKNRNELLSQKFEPSVGRSAAPLRRDRRFAVSAIWTAMGLIKDFSDRVTFIKETIAKVKSWFGVGDAPGTPPPNTQDVINEINGIKDQVEDLRDDVLAGQEWGFVLSVLGDPIKNLKALVFQEDDYLGEMKQTGLADSLKKLAQNRFYISQVNDPACSDRRNLASLQNGILSGTGIHKPLYEAYADKIGQQNTGTVLDVVKFIARTQQMQAHVYALLEEGVDFKPISSTEKQHEIDLYQYDVQRVTPRQGPRIAEALNVIMDHKGSAVFGRIKAKHNPHSGKCLTRKVVGSSQEAYVELQTCSDTDNDQLWKLSDDDYIIPKSHTNEAMYFQGSGTIPNWTCKIGHTKYSQPRVQTKSSSSTTFKFQFSTSDFTLFQIKKRSANECLTTLRVGGTDTLTCTKPCAAIGSSGSGDTWFEWEPKEEEQ